MKEYQYYDHKGRSTSAKKEYPASTVGKKKKPYSEKGGGYVTSGDNRAAALESRPDGGYAKNFKGGAHMSSTGTYWTRQRPGENVAPAGKGGKIKKKK